MQYVVHCTCRLQKKMIFFFFFWDVLFIAANFRSSGQDGKGLSGSSSRVSSSSVPPTPRSEGEILQSTNLKRFTFSELKSATRNFRPDSMLGEGGFGSVFKGWIDEHTLTAAKPGTGLVIAVKRLNQESLQGHREWLVSTLSIMFVVQYSESVEICIHSYRNESFH